MMSSRRRFHARPALTAVALGLLCVVAVGSVSRTLAQARRTARKPSPGSGGVIAKPSPTVDPSSPPLPESGEGGANASALTAPGGAGGFAEPGATLPFRMVWGDAPERLQRTLAGGGTKVTERRVSADGRREVWTVEGLLRAGPKLGSVLLTFLDHALTGVELRYGAPDWKEEKYNEAMGTLRRQLEKDMGAPGELVSRQSGPAPSPTLAVTPDPTPTAASSSSPSPDPSASPSPSPPPTDEPVHQTLTGYAWKKGDSVVELFYFSAEQPGKALAFRSLSVHFRYRDPSGGNGGGPGPEASPAPPGADPLPQ